MGGEIGGGIVSANQPLQTKWTKETAPVVNKLNEETIKRMEERIRELEEFVRDVRDIRDELDGVSTNQGEFKQSPRKRCVELTQFSETIARTRRRIQELEAWITTEGVRNDTCTFSILKRVCDGCRCERRDK